MDILLFGGSFDPPHLGHLRLLKSALATLRPDRAYLLPAWRSPLKSGHQAPGADRLRMARLLARELPRALARRVRVDPFEIRRGRTTYSFEVLREFQKRHPGARLWLLAGSDTAAGLRRWRRPEELKRSCGWAVGRRPGSSGRLAGFKRLVVLKGSFPAISSTALRSRLLAGLDASRWIPGSVAARIRRRGLYGLAVQRRLKASLAPERWRHTLAVARLAVDLAERHGLDAEAAALAGLLHDCGRRLGLTGMARYARARRLKVPRLREVLRHAPILLHAYVGADMARREFRVSEARVLSAIRNHTLGRPGMPELDRLLYVADCASEDRGFPAARRVRALARRDLRAAFRAAARAKLDYAAASGGWLHPGTAAFWDWVLRETR